MSTPSPAHDALAAFCHRLGSPLGAAVNHAYLLDMDREALPDTAVEALDGARSAIQDMTTLLATARIWLDAQVRTFRSEPLDGAQVCALFDIAPPGGPSVRGELEVLGELEALRTVGECMAFHGQPASAELAPDHLQVRWTATPTAANVPVDRLLDPFGGAGTLPRWACAQALVRGLSGTLSVAHGQDGALEATLSLPLVRP